MILLVIDAYLKTYLNTTLDAARFIKQKAV